MDTENNRKIFFPLIQLWRALAAVMVVYGHVMLETKGMAAGAGGNFDYLRYPHAAGVDLFFVISGFVIMIAGRDLFARPGAWREFMLRRIIRIVPLYWLYTGLMMAALLALPQAFDTAQAAGGHFIKSLLFIPHENPAGEGRPLLSLGWSLNYEMYFYVIFAALLFLPRQTAIRVLCVYFPLSILLGLFLPDSQTAVKFWFHPQALEFLAGAVTGHLYLNGVRLPARAFLPLIAAGFLLLAGLVLLPPLAGDMPYSFVRTPVGGLAGILLVMAASLPLGAEHRKVPRVLTALGASSYTLYLAHPFIIGFMKMLWPAPGYFGLFAGLALAACLAGGYVLYLIIEKPLLRVLQGFVAGPVSPATRRKSAPS